MSPQLTVKQLSQGALQPVYALISVESLLIDDAVAILKARVLGPQADFNSDDVDLGLGGGIDRLLSVVQTLPMMAQRRWVRARNLQKLAAKDHAALLQYVSAPTPTTVLVLSADKLDGRTKLGQTLNKSGALVALELPRPNQLPQWIVDRAHLMHVRIEPDAALLLSELVGCELGILQRNVDMLALLAGPHSAITAEHVAEGIAASRVHSVFELTAALGLRNWVEASLLMRNILGGGEGALLILAMVARQLRLLIQTKAFGGRHQDLAYELGVRPFVADGLEQQAKRFVSRDLHHALRLVAQADVRLKSSGLCEPLVLDNMLAQMLPVAP